MAFMRKRTPPAHEAAPSAGAGLLPGLRHSDIPGVWLNSANVPCDASGVALSFLQVKRADAARFEEVLGEVADTPAKFLKGVALDPRQPMPVRIDAAKAAAPYTDRKQPIGVDGGVDPATGAPQPLIDVSKIQGMPTEDLVRMVELLRAAGAAV